MPMQIQRRREWKFPFTFCVDIGLSAKPFVDLTELDVLASTARLLPRLK